MFEFQCGSCEKWHQGVPTFGWDYPINYLTIPEKDRAQRVKLSSDECVIDKSEFYVRGCLEIPVHGLDEPFIWGVWVSLSEKSFSTFRETYNLDLRSHVNPMFGWLNAHIWIYPETLDLKTMAHLRNKKTRPFIELEPTDHPLAVEQRMGISQDRLKEIFEMMTHPDKFKKAGGNP